MSKIDLLNLEHSMYILCKYKSLCVLVFTNILDINPLPLNTEKENSS